MVMKKNNYRKFSNALKREYNSIYTLLNDLQFDPEPFLKNSGFKAKNIKNTLYEISLLSSKYPSIQKLKIIFVLKLMVSSERIKPQKTSKLFLGHFKKLEDELGWFVKNYPDFLFTIGNEKIASHLLFGSIKKSILPLKNFIFRKGESHKRGPTPIYLRRFSASFLFLEFVNGGIKPEESYAWIANLTSKIVGNPKKGSLAEIHKIKALIATERNRLHVT